MHCVQYSWLSLISLDFLQTGISIKNSLDTFCIVNIKPRRTSRDRYRTKSVIRSIGIYDLRNCECQPFRDLRRTVSTERDEGKRHQSNCTCMRGSSALQSRHRAREEHFRVQKYSGNRSIVFNGPCALHPAVPCARIG